MPEDDDEDRHAILEGLEAISEEGELEVVSWEELMKHNTEDDLWCAPIVDAGIALFVQGHSHGACARAPRALFVPAHPPR